MSPASQQSITSEERTYLRSRVILCVLLLAIFPVYPSVSGEFNALPLYAFLLLVLAFGTGYGYYASRRGLRSVVEAMTWMLVPDLSVVAGFTFLFHNVEDVFYPVAIFLTIAYALVARRRDMWLVGAAVTSAYVGGHLLAHEAGILGYVLFAFKAAAIPVLGVMVSGSMSRQRRRQEEAVKAVANEANEKEQLESRLAELQAVVRITERVHSSLDLEKVGPEVLEVLGGVLGMKTCSLFVIDKVSSETVFSASRGDVSNHPKPSWGEHVVSAGHFACKSVCERGNVMVLFCADQGDMDRLSPADGLVLTAIANQLVVAVENSHLYGLTKVLAITDELTGLFNYRELQNRLTQEIDRAARYGGPLSILMIDADGFKGYNDAYGHIAGDDALSELGGVLRLAVREVDFVSRYGGEEFTVILPETDAAGAFVVAEKIREAVADHAFLDAENRVSHSLTVSVGVATYPTHAEDKESLLREADDALYRAKREGKNRVRTPQAVRSDKTGD